MHSAAHILIMHLNIIRMFWQDTLSQTCAAEYLHTTGGSHCSKKKMYMLIYYTFQMHLYAVFLSAHSPVLSHVGGRTGHHAMPHQYAYW